MSQLTHKWLEHKVTFILTDNGKGFNIREVQLGNGLYNMKTRLKSIKFTYNFTSEIKNLS